MEKNKIMLQLRCEKCKNLLLVYTPIAGLVIEAKCKKLIKNTEESLEESRPKYKKCKHLNRIEV